MLHEIVHGTLSHESSLLLSKIFPIRFTKKNREKLFSFPEPAAQGRPGQVARCWAFSQTVSLLVVGLKLSSSTPFFSNNYDHGPNPEAPFFHNY